MAVRTRTTVALAVMALGAGSVSLAPPVAADDNDTVVINCVGKKVVEPKEISFACADDGVTVQNLTWTTWNMNTARGRGTLVWNTCLPTDCAGGIVQKYRARIVLDRVASGPNVTVFSRMRLTFVNGGPAGLDTGTLTLPNQGS